MNIAPKTAVAAWLSIVATSAALLSFGWSSDPNSALRAADMELSLLHDGPGKLFVDKCRAFEQQRDQRGGAGQDESREIWAEDFLRGGQSSAPTTGDFEVRGLLWCPYPAKSQTVKEALALVTDRGKSPLTLWPHSSFLKALGAAIQRAPATAGDDPYFKFHSLAADIASGHLISWIEVTSDPAAGTHSMFECASTDAVFDQSDTSLAPTFPLRLIVSLNGGIVYCLKAEDVPPVVERLYGSGGVVMVGFYPRYFGERVAESGLGSNKPFAQTEMTATSEGEEFDFPALRSQIKEVGVLSVQEAYDFIHARSESAAESAKLFGIELPIRLFTLLALIALPLLAWIFLSGYRHHGVGALPETLQGLPSPMLAMALVFTVCVVPAGGLLLMGHRLQFIFPEVAGILPIAGGGWLVGSMLGLWRARRARMGDAD